MRVFDWASLRLPAARSTLAYFVEQADPFFNRADEMPTNEQASNPEWFLFLIKQ